MKPMKLVFPGKINYIFEVDKIHYNFPELSNNVICSIFIFQTSSKLQLKNIETANFLDLP